MWKEYGEDEKRVYLEQAAADKARYESEVAANPENVVAPKKTTKTKKTKTVVIVVKTEPVEEDDVLTSVVEEHINTMEELARTESPVAGNKKKRKPNRPKEEIAAEKEAKAARKAEREAKKVQAQAKQDQKQEQVLREYQPDIIAELQEERNTVTN